jgi:hypothetical protein
VDRRVDPSSTLREQDGPSIGRDCPGDGVGRKLHFVRREVLHHERREVSVLAEREEVLLVEGVDEVLRIVVDDALGDDDRSALVGGSETVDREATGETGDGAEEGFEGFGEVVRDEVFVDLRA